MVVLGFPIMVIFALLAVKWFGALPRRMNLAAEPFGSKVRRRMENLIFTISTKRDSGVARLRFSSVEGRNGSQEMNPWPKHPVITRLIHGSGLTS